ncbi:hypothetical protein EI167_16295 [Pseudoalteromonas prydzensis]|uniref:DUF304 domain-containing protein n=1 Tax=Pseudoalteromonas prydzensis TaxID=182141 RepID=A0ABR9FQ87_9GAMM|nr:hypothetical protein [Pseudoalteromonas prydzensis]
MIIESMYIYIIIAFIVIWFIEHRVNLSSSHKALIEDGDRVIVNTTILSRCYGFSSKVVIKSDITKVQIADSCISLFTQSGHAIDIWLPKQTCNNIVNLAQQYFRNASFVKV